MRRGVADDASELAPDSTGAPTSGRHARRAARRAVEDQPGPTTTPAAPTSGRHARRAAAGADDGSMPAHPTDGQIWIGRAGSGGAETADALPAGAEAQAPGRRARRAAREATLEEPEAPTITEGRRARRAAREARSPDAG